MKTTGLQLVAACLLAGFVMTAQADEKSVKVTPLGSHDGEFCRFDRALIFEDPDGTRILYDAGRTVRGADDPRLGQIDAVLLSHVHGDHLGDRHQAEANAGSCEKPEFTVTATPNSNSVNIVVGKKAQFIVGGEMASFFSRKVEAAGGDPKQVKLVRFGAQHSIGGVSIASVPAVHSNGLNPAFLDKEHAEALEANGLTAYVGPPGGYVLTFSNGLVVYLSGDTGITAEQELVVNRFYKANLAVINIGGTFTTGPTEAAYVMNAMVKPKSVIASHANEKATENGKLLAGTRTETFIKAVEAPVHLPLSGVTMEFDGDGACVAGCTSGAGG
ncbi:MAG: MBL fold metallo-hydrolase [Sedimenticolaceae bacterium]|nr:MBL fold metallo-hydrolase [Sedimenticolaceae bacterium]